MLMLVYVLLNRMRYHSDWKKKCRLKTFSREKQNNEDSEMELTTGVDRIYVRVGGEGRWGQEMLKSQQKN